MLFDHKTNVELFYISCQYGEIDNLKLLLDTKSIGVNYHPPLGTKCPLCEATFNGQINIVKELLIRGAFPNGTCKKYHPLKIAAKFNEVEIVKLLLRCGSNFRLTIGGKPFYYIMESPGREEVEKYVIELSQIRSAHHNR
jgi:ankyrin repeat protein